MATTIREQLNLLKSGEFSNAKHLISLLPESEKYRLIIGNQRCLVAGDAGAGRELVFSPLPISSLSAERKLDIHQFCIASDSLLWNLEEIDQAITSQWINASSETWDAQLLMETAVEFLQPNLIKVAVAQGAAVNFKGLGNNCESVLSRATEEYLGNVNATEETRRNTEEVISILIQSGAEMEEAFRQVIRKLVISERSISKDVQLMLANNLLSKFLESGVDINHQDSQGNTAIIQLINGFAGSETKLLRIAYIIEKICHYGVDTNIKSANGNTVIQLIKSLSDPQKSYLQQSITLLECTQTKLDIERQLESISPSLENEANQHRSERRVVIF